MSKVKKQEENEDKIFLIPDEEVVYPTKKEMEETHKTLDMVRGIIPPESDEDIHLMKFVNRIKEEHNL